MDTSRIELAKRIADLQRSQDELLERTRSRPALGVFVPIRVVIAEDEAIIRLDLKETLEEEGYEVVGETGRGDEAVALVRELKPDLAILDVRMPGHDGLSAAREITADRLAAVLVLTAYSQRNLIEEARDAGALAYVVKPFQRSELIPAIEVALGRHREMKALEGEVSSLEEQLETRASSSIAPRASSWTTSSMREADAFGFIQKTAMQQRVTMKVIAQQVIDGELTPEVTPGRTAAAVATFNESTPFAIGMQARTSAGHRRLAEPVAFVADEQARSARPAPIRRSRRCVRASTRWW